MLFGLVSTPQFGRDWFGPARRDGSISGEWGMWAFLASLSVFFIAGFVLLLLSRAGAGARWTESGAVQLPRLGLGLSTLFLLSSSGSLYWAERSVRRGRQRALRAGVVLSGLLGVAFLVSQAWNWWLVHSAGHLPRANLVGVFYILTALHVVHVLGGLIPLGIVTGRALAGRYTPERHAGLRLCGMYWHFLDGVWLVMAALLLLS